MSIKIDGTVPSMRSFLTPSFSRGVVSMNRFSLVRVIRVDSAVNGLFDDSTSEIVPTVGLKKTTEDDPNDCECVSLFER